MRARSSTERSRCTEKRYSRDDPFANPVAGRSGARAPLRGGKEAGAFGQIVSELMTEDAKGAWGIAEATCDFCRGQLIDDGREPLLVLVAMHDRGAHLVEVERLLRDENHRRSPGDSRPEGDVARVTRSLDWFVEVVNPEVSKAAALAMAAARLGIAQTDVCAIGDNTNDEDMVAWAGFGVAMGNAPATLKGFAKYVTGTVDEAGVAQVIERFVIGKEVRGTRD